MALDPAFYIMIITLLVSALSFFLINFFKKGEELICSVNILITSLAIKDVQLKEIDKRLQNIEHDVQCMNTVLSLRDTQMNDIEKRFINIETDIKILKNEKNIPRQ